MGYDADLFVIGAGSGGVRAARFAASLGAKVIVAEAARLGGTCVNVGCVPKKLMVYASEYRRHAEDAVGFGWSEQAPRFDWAAFMRAKDAEILRLNGIYGRLLENSGCTVLDGWARFVDAHTVEVNGKRYTAERILIATGGRPWRPDVPGAELGIDSDDFFALPEQPGRTLIVGGGYIAVEFAGILHGMGSPVSLVARSPHLLTGFDRDVQQTLAEELTKQGIGVHLAAQVVRVDKQGEELSVELTTGEVVVVDCLLWATGRSPNTGNLGLAEAGVEQRKNGTIVVHGPDFNTSVPHIHAVGDVIGTPALTPVALEQGMALAKRLYGSADDTVHYDNLPTAVFSQPSVGTVGLTEAQARLAHDVVVYRSRFRPMRHTISGRDERTMMKLVVDRNTDRVLGCHMVGPDAGEIVQGLAVALNAGATKAVFDRTVGIHPTAAEEFVTMRTPVED